MGKAVDLSGLQFGRLTAIERAPKPEHRKGTANVFWRCRCNCGVERVVSTAELRTGNTKSCGAHRIFRKVGEAGCRILMSHYRSGARRRGLAFGLSYEQFAALTSAACHYCGCGPANTMRASGNAKQKARDNSVYLYNGIDRVDSSRGYVADNCVTACMFCNGAKGSMSAHDFLAWIASVYSHSIAPINEPDRMERAA